MNAIDKTFHKLVTKEERHTPVGQALRVRAQHPLGIQRRLLYTCHSLARNVLVL